MRIPEIKRRSKFQSVGPLRVDLEVLWFLLLNKIVLRGKILRIQRVEYGKDVFPEFHVCRLDFLKLRLQFGKPVAEVHRIIIKDNEPYRAQKETNAKE